MRFGRGDGCLKFDGFSCKWRRMSAKWSDINKITGERFSLPLGYSLLATKEATSILGALMKMFETYDSLRRGLNIKGLPLIALLKSGCTDGGANEKAAFALMQGELTKVLTKLKAEGIDVDDTRQLVWLACSEHGLCSTQNSYVTVFTNLTSTLPRICIF